MDIDCLEDVENFFNNLKGLDKNQIYNLNDMFKNEPYCNLIDKKTLWNQLMKRMSQKQYWFLVHLFTQNKQKKFIEVLMQLGVRLKDDHKI